MNPARLLRLDADRTQQQLATLADTSQSAIAAYERGRKSPTWRTVERLAHAAGYAVDGRYMPALTREDRRSLDGPLRGQTSTWTPSATASVPQLT